MVVVGWCSTWSSSRTSSWHLFVVLQQVEISFDLSSRLRVDQVLYKCKPLVIVVVLVIVAVVVLVDVLMMVAVGVLVDVLVIVAAVVLVVIAISREVWREVK